MKYIDMNPKVYNVLGRNGENEAYTARFPQNGWSEEYGGSGQFYLVVKRADGTVYPAVITAGDGYVYWQIETADVAYAGMGECEYQYRVNDVVVKSVQYKTRVLVSLSGGETPAPEQPWVEQVLQASAEAKAAAQEASETLADAVRKSVQVSRTASMTQPVGIDSDGKLWALPGGGTGDGDMSKATYDPDEAVADAGGIAAYVEAHGGGTSDFDELTNRPKYNGSVMDGNTDIPEVVAQVQADFNQSDSTAVDYIKNKPVAITNAQIDALFA